MYYQEGDSLGSLLELVVQNYESGRVEYWTDDEEGQKYLELVDSIAKSLLTASHDVVAAPLTLQGVEFDWEAVQQLSSLKIFQPQIQEKLQIEVAYDLTAGIHQMGDRALDLAKLVLRERPNESVLRFLQRLGRCYILGFLPECVILCRGVLENAVTEAFARKRLSLPQDEEGNSTMRQKLKAAVRFNLLSPAGESAAWTIWNRGNVAVHNDPTATKDVYGTVETTLGVLQELYG